MQIVADHQHACPRIAPHLRDKSVKGRFTRLIQPLGRFIQHQQAGVAQQSARQHDALQLPARQGGDLALACSVHPHASQRVGRFFIADAVRQ